MNNIEVTVFCTAYNHGKYIRKALDGFVKQKTHFEYEVIIHDDASTDETADIINEYYEKYPNIIVPLFEEENQFRKKSYLKEYCLSRAKGKYIAFCEGDDYWTDELKLQRQYDAMENNRQAVLCVHKTICTNEDDSYNSKIIPSKNTLALIGQSREISQKEFSELLFKIDSYPFHTSSYFIRRSVFKNDEIRLELIKYFNGDMACLFRCLSEGTVFYINEFMSCRRLFTIGNWNNRFIASSDDYKISVQKRIILGYLYYNKLTEKKYDKLIAYSVFWSICSMAIHFDYYKVNELRLYVKNQIKYPAFVSLKLDLAYSLMILNPKLYQKLARLYKSVDNTF